MSSPRASNQSRTLWRSWLDLSERPRRSFDRTAQLALVRFDLCCEKHCRLEGIRRLVDRDADSVIGHDDIHRSIAGTSPVELSK